MKDSSGDAGAFLSYAFFKYTIRVGSKCTISTVHLGHPFLYTILSTIVDARPAIGVMAMLIRAGPIQDAAGPASFGGNVIC